MFRFAISSTNNTVKDIPLHLSLCVSAHVSILWIPRLHFKHCFCSVALQRVYVFTFHQCKCSFSAPLLTFLLSGLLIFTILICENDILWFQIAFFLLWSSMTWSRKNTSSWLPDHFLTHHNHLCCFSNSSFHLP